MPKGTPIPAPMAFSVDDSGSHEGTSEEREELFADGATAFWVGIEEGDVIKSRNEVADKGVSETEGAVLRSEAITMTLEVADSIAVTADVDAIVPEPSISPWGSKWLPVIFQ